MKQYRCKYCNKNFQNNNKRKGHQIWCSMNPKLNQTKIKLSKSMKKDRIPKKLYTVNCVVCNKQYTVELTEKALKNKRYKHTCQNCSSKRVSWNKGLTKQTDNRIKKFSQTINKKYKNGQISRYRKPLTKQHKKNISEGMKKAHKQGRAWNIGMSRWNNEMSYPQKFFSMIIENQFKNKNYINEYPVGKYSLDFAWVEDKKCIQIDGQQHLKQQAILHDKIRDQFLKSNNWKILRISWKKMCNNVQKYIDISKKFIDK